MTRLLRRPAPEWVVRPMLFVGCYLTWAILTMLLFGVETIGSSMFMAAGAWLWWVVDERARLAYERYRAALAHEAQP